MVIKKIITENQLKRIITESVKRILKEMDEIEPGFGDYSDDIPPQGFYICSETNYNDGNVETWIGDENDAQECRQCSEGSAYGPFSTYEDAEQYAEENGMNLGSEDYANNFGNALQDTFVDSLNENRLNKIVAKSVRKTLNEAFMNKKWPSSKPTEPINKEPSPIGMYKKFYPNIKVKPVHGEKDGYNVRVAIGNKGVLIGSKGWEKYIYNPRSKSWIGPYQFGAEKIAFMLASKLEKTMEGPEDSRTKSVRDAYMGGDQYAGMLQERKRKRQKH